MPEMEAMTEEGPSSKNSIDGFFSGNENKSETAAESPEDDDGDALLDSSEPVGKADCSDDADEKESLGTSSEPIGSPRGDPKRLFLSYYGPKIHRG